MIRHITCTILLMACFPGAYAQKAMPKYTASGYPNNIYAGDLFAPYWKLQCVYTPQQFPGMPSGAVKAIYLRWANQDAKQIPLPLKKLRIGLRGTSFSSWSKNAPIDTFIHFEQYQLDTAVYTFRDSVENGDWIKIVLTKNTFNYASTSNFVMEIAYDTPSNIAGKYHEFYTTNLNNVPRRFEGPRDSSYYLPLALSPQTFDLGIDQVVVGVTGIENITSFGLFPNPVSEGRFNISFDTKQSVKAASIIVNDAAGRQVYARQYSDVGSSFFKQVDVRGVAKGLYFLKLEVDGEVISRRVVLD